MQSVTNIAGIFLAFAVAFASPAFAQEAPSSAPLSPASADETELLSLEDMEALAGGTGIEVIVDTSTVTTAINSGNTVSGDVVSTGQVNIGANAFSGYSGLGKFVINTGHNNNLQSSMAVSVLLTPPAGD